ncbi:MAG: hypothetical protein QXH91_06705 [Candidatus Bathyarchaeia archaeon]
MVRRQVIPDKEYPYKCPICKSYGRDSWKNIARHIAMKGNNKLGEIHREWRIANGLLGDYETNKEINQMILEIMKIFGWQDC